MVPRPRTVATATRCVSRSATSSSTFFFQLAAAEQSASVVIEMAPLASQSAPDVKVAYPLSTAPPRSARRAFMMLASSKVGNATCSGPASEENAPAGARPAPIMSRRANRAIAFR